MVVDTESEAELGWWFARRSLYYNTYPPRVVRLPTDKILMDLEKMTRHQLPPPTVPPPGAAAAPGDFSEYAKKNPDDFFSDKVELNEVEWGKMKKEEEHARLCGYEPMCDTSCINDCPRKRLPLCAACTFDRMCSICQF